MGGNDANYLARSGPNRTMNTGNGMGARVQPQVAAAGMLALSMRLPKWQHNWLATYDLKIYTSHTIASKERMRMELARVRAQGWALSEQPLELNDRGVAAMSVTMPMGHESSQDTVNRVLSVLKETAQAMRNLI